MTTKLRARKPDGGHALWLNPAEAADLVRSGLARPYGSKRRMIGLTLTCSVAIAGTHLYGSGRPPCSRPGIIREHVAERFYLYQHPPQVAA